MLNELDVAQHTVMVKLSDQTIPRLDLEQRVKDVFGKLLQMENIEETAIVSVNVPANYSECIKLKRKLAQHEALFA